MTQTGEGKVGQLSRGAVFTGHGRCTSVKVEIMG